MARINVEDSLDSNFRFRKLVKLLNGNYFEALGMTVAFWRIAQTYWGKDEKGIPKDEFVFHEFEILLQSGLAIETENGVIAHGAENHFEWYLQKCRAGRSSASKSKRPKDLDHGNGVPLSRKVDPVPRNDFPLPPPSPSPSPSLSHNNNHTEGDITHSCVKTGPGNDPPFKFKYYESIRLMNAVISALQLENSEDALKEIDPDLFKILKAKYSQRTWQQWLARYIQAIKKKKVEFFEKDLREHIYSQL